MTNECNKTDVIEEESCGGEITIPFDPNKIRIRKDPFTLGQLIEKIECKEVVFDTDFQRKDDLWDNEKQSRLIESVLLGFPLPSFYFDEPDGNDDNVLKEERKWLVIDGLQRCSTFRNFCVTKKLILSGLEYLVDFNGLGYDQLPRTLQRRINQTSITIFILEKGTPINVKYNIFKRLNTGGLVLTPQEIRHAMNQGKPADTIAKLSRLTSFKTATNYQISTDRMEDRDFVTRFVAFYLQSYSKYQTDLDTFMTEGMASIRHLSDNECTKMISDFDKSMNTAYEIFGEDAFRKREYGSDRRKPLNKALFEVLSVAFAKLTVLESDQLISKKEQFCEKFMDLNRQLYFKNSLTQSTGKPASVRHRHEGIAKIISDTLSSTL